MISNTSNVAALQFGSVIAQNDCQRISKDIIRAARQMHQEKISKEEKANELLWKGCLLISALGTIAYYSIVH